MTDLQAKLHDILAEVWGSYGGSEDEATAIAQIETAFREAGWVEGRGTHYMRPGFSHSEPEDY